MFTIDELLRALLDEAEICLMDKRGRLKGVPRSFLPEVVASLTTQLVIDYRQEILPGSRSRSSGADHHGHESRVAVAWSSDLHS